MNVLGIVRKYLEDNNYAGLYSDGECGCQLDDLAPCGEMMGDCSPGDKVEGCTCGAGCDFHIVQRGEEQ